MPYSVIVAAEITQGPIYLLLIALLTADMSHRQPHITQCIIVDYGLLDFYYVRLQQ